MKVLVLLNDHDQVIGRYVSANQKSLERVATARLRKKCNGVAKVLWENPDHEPSKPLMRVELFGKVAIPRTGYWRWDEPGQVLVERVQL